jgi:hypothetical protein
MRWRLLKGIGHPSKIFNFSDRDEAARLTAGPKWLAMGRKTGLGFFFYL